MYTHMQMKTCTHTYAQAHKHTHTLSLTPTRFTIWQGVITAGPEEVDASLSNRFKVAFDFVDSAQRY